MRRFNPEVWGELVMRPDGLWYAAEEIWPCIEGLFVNPPEHLSDTGVREKREIVEFFSRKLDRGMVVLGNKPIWFNDDDRWTEADGWKQPIDTIVIHHTSTHPRLSYEKLNVYGLLRLYCPLYMNRPAFKIDGMLQPVSSGHLYRDKQTFAGYHHIVYDVGSAKGMTFQLLDDRCTGFHAGNYNINCRSVGIAVVGDLSDRCPTDQAISVINKIISKYPDAKTIMGHKEVPRKDGKTTSCPGDKWEEWKGLLKIKA